MQPSSQPELMEEGAKFGELSWAVSREAARGEVWEAL